MKMAALFFVTIAVFAQPPQGGEGGPPSFFRMSPILNAVDVDRDGALSSAEIANAPAQLRKLDKNGDGKLTQDEAGMQTGRGGPGGGRGRGEEEGSGVGDEPPAQAPSAEDLTDTLMMFDANHDGKLEKSEVPERMQGLFERGDTNHDGVLTKDEIIKLAEANRQQQNQFGGEGGRGGDGRGRGRGPGGPGGFDLAFNALDTNHDGEISSDEIANAPVSLKTLDKNGDGQITSDEVTPQFGGRGPGGPGRDN
jgi:Ca2+-binding EF-hand superfamily protein